MNDEQNTLNETEEKAMVGILYNHLAFATTMEMFGELGEGGVTRIENLRATLTKLLRKYNLIATLPKETFLLLGLTEFLTGEDLQAWSMLETNKHMQNRAKYFITKMQEKK